ncbi:hypothetical protein D3C83_11980 [compost metagenome]
MFEKKVRAAIIQNQKTETIGMPVYPAAHEIQLVDDANGVAPIAHDFALAFHRAETAVKRRALVFGNAERPLEFVLADRHAAITQDLQNVFAAGHRLRVARALALAKWIVAAKRMTGSA